MGPNDDIEIQLADQGQGDRSTTHNEIAPVTDFKKIPKDAKCQEASPMSGMRYIACGGPAVAIIASDHRAYLMCFDCAMHNLRNRGAAVIYANDPVLQKMIKDRSVRVVAEPELRKGAERTDVGNSTVVEERLPER